MKKIEKMEMIKASVEKDYIEKLNKVLEEFKALNLEVEISHAMCQSNNGIGYMYSATVIGRYE